MVRLKVNDMVKIPKRKDTVEDGTEFLYGTVAGFNHGTAMVVINLSTPYKGCKTTTVPAYMASVLTMVEYVSLTHNDSLDMWEKATKILSDDPTPIESYMTCQHDWESSGFNPNTGQEWFNCSICGAPKEKI